MKYMNPAKSYADLCPANDTGLGLLYNPAKSKQGVVVNPGARKKRTPDPSTTRTDKDWVMIVLGVLLAILFVVGVYMSLVQGDKSAVPKPKGPIKGPKPMSMSEPWRQDSSCRLGPVLALLRE